MLRILLVCLLSSPVMALDTESLNDRVARNLKYVALTHTFLKNDWEGIPQQILGDLVIEQSVELLKGTINSERPDGSDNDSFPSGHTSDAFAPAWYMYHRYGLNESLPYLAAASYVGYARVKLDRHRPIDVGTSIVISYYISKYFTGSLGEEARIGISYNEGLTLNFFKEI
jgi:hypothetical protein